MTTENSRFFTEGRDYWYQYVKLNGYAFYPTEAGIAVLSRNLDVNTGWLRKCINIFLSA